MFETDVKESTVEIVIEDVDTLTLFTESLLALSDVLSDATVGTPVTHEVRVGGDGIEALLSSWIEELIRLTSEEGFLAERVEKERLEGTEFRARVAGVRDVAPTSVRPVQLRSVELKRLDDGAWATRVVLDA